MLKKNDKTFFIISSIQKGFLEFKLAYYLSYLKTIPDYIIIVGCYSGFGFYGSNRSKNAKMIKFSNIKKHMKLLNLYFIDNVLYDEYKNIIGSKLSDNVFVSALDFDTTCKTCDKLVNITPESYNPDFQTKILKTREQNLVAAKQHHAIKAIQYFDERKFKYKFSQIEPMIVDEIEALMLSGEKDDIFSIKILKDLFYAISWNSNGDILMITKPMIIKVDHKFNVGFGNNPMLIYVNPIEDKRMLMEPLTILSCEGRFHPHVNGAGIICTGNVGNKLKMLNKMANYNSLLILINELTSEYNDNSPYVSMSINVCKCSHTSRDFMKDTCKICDNPVCHRCNIKGNHLDCIKEILLPKLLIRYEELLNSGTRDRMRSIEYNIQYTRETLEHTVYYIQ